MYQRGNIKRQYLTMNLISLTWTKKMKEESNWGGGIRVTSLQGNMGR